MVIFKYEPINYVLLRNFIFVGIPYFTIGLFLSNHPNYFNRFCQNQKLSCFLILLFMCTTLLEHYLLVFLNANATRDHYLSSTFLAITLFSFFGNSKWNDRKIKVMKRIGRKYSTMIYIVHPMIIMLMQGFFSKINILSYYWLLGPILVFLVTVLFSLLFYNVKVRIFKAFKKIKV